jgi:hypothetical protein
MDFVKSWVKKKDIWVELLVKKWIIHNLFIFMEVVECVLLNNAPAYVDFLKLYLIQV